MSAKMTEPERALGRMLLDLQVSRDRIGDRPSFVRLPTWKYDALRKALDEAHPGWGFEETG